MMSREMSGWMSVSDEAGSPLVLFHKALQVYRVNWLRAKARMDRWQEEVTLVQNETRWMHLWLSTIGTSGKEGKKRVNKRV